jgi:hypothetical protein
VQLPEENQIGPSMAAQGFSGIIPRDISLQSVGMPRRIWTFFEISREANKLF